MREWWSKFRSLLTGRRGLAEDLHEEIRTHLELEIQENLSLGMSPDEAQIEAQRNFGNTTLIEERARESWAFYALETFLQDLRYGLRTLGRGPGLSVVAVLSLALGIGANTALFSVVNAVMLRMLPVQQPERLLLLSWSARAWPEKFVDDVEGSVETDKKTGRMVSLSFSYEGYLHMSRENRVFDSVLASSSNDGRANVTFAGRARDAVLQAVSGNYFQTLGVPALTGRTLQPSDDRADAPPAAVLSYAFWQRHFGGDASVAGASIAINGIPATIVGIAPREFFGVEPGQSPDLFVPLSLYVEQYRRAYASDLKQSRMWWLTIIGRLKPGSTLQQAETDLKILYDQSLRVSRDTLAGDAIVPSLRLEPASRGLNNLRDEFSTSLLLLMTMVGLVLLIACANVAGLLLARSTARRRELSVRFSLGAGRLRIVRQLLTESVLLGVIGGSVGLLFGRWIGSLVSALFAGTPFHPIALSVELDARVLAFTAAVSIASGILFGLAPALRAGRTDPYPALKLAVGIPGHSGRGLLSGKILVGAQVAMCLLLVMGAGLLTQTLRRLQKVDVGFNRQHLLVFEVQPGLNGYKEARLGSYYEEMERRIAAIHGVRSVGMSLRGPIGDGWSQGRAVIPGYIPPGKGLPFYRHWVSPGFFGTLEIPLILGRLPGLRDSSTAPRVVVVNEKLVQAYLHGANPIGLRFEAGDYKAEIVGVVGNAKYGSLRDEVPPTAYFPYRQFTRDFPASMTFEVRTQEDPRVVAPLIQNAAASIDQDVPVAKMRTEGEVIDQALFLEKALALLSGSFGVLALALACVGLYGTMSYAVARRTNEIGIRLALGAGRGAILRMVFGETLAIALGGIALGAPLAWLGTRLLENHLFGLSPHDPFTAAATVGALITITVIAGYVPAVRASRVDPIEALRCE